MNGYYELREEMFLKRILKGGDYFVDVGANVGIFALTAAAKVGSFGRVFCYEPNPRVADLLQKSSLMNWMHERVVVRSVAVGSKRTTANLMVAQSCLGGAALEDRRGHGGAHDRTRELLADAELVDVEVVTLDQEFPFDIPIRAVKIDAEGFEAEVLKGADRLFRSRCIDFVIIEAVEEITGRTWPSLLGAIAKLEEYGYEPYIFVRDGAIRRTNLQSIGLTGGQASRNIVLKRHGAQY
jgi:FkbM family methyltransferase